MARETKAEREARVERENAEYHAAQVAAWPKRLMENLERATMHGWEVSVKAGKFEVSFYDSYNDRETKRFNYTASEYNDWDSMERLEWELDSADRREEEATRKANLRAAALSKLSKEEREELGL